MIEEFAKELGCSLGVTFLCGGFKIPTEIPTALHST